MKALVKVNGISVGMFYSMHSKETKSEMHKRILDVIYYRYGICNIDLKWED